MVLSWNSLNQNGTDTTNGDIMARGRAHNQCYIPTCKRDAPFAFSWRIRGPKEGAETNDRIEPGNTGTTSHSCETHLGAMREMARGLFRSPSA